MLAELVDLGQGPYFSITGEIGAGGHYAAGCIHVEIAEAFPEFKKYIKWHLCNVNDGPMHYIANALYHAGFTQYIDAMNSDTLKSHIIWGVLDSDQDIDIESLMNNEQLGYKTPEAVAKSEELKNVLNARLPQLMEKMHADFLELFGPSFQDLIKK